MKTNSHFSLFDDAASIQITHFTIEYAVNHKVEVKSVGKHGKNVDGSFALLSVLESESKILNGS